MYSSWRLCKWVCLRVIDVAPAGTSASPNLTSCFVLRAGSAEEPPRSSCLHWGWGAGVLAWAAASSLNILILPPAAHLLSKLLLCVLRLLHSASAGFLVVGLLSVSSCSDPTR